VSETNASASDSRGGTPPIGLVLLLCGLLVICFILLRFPWDSLGRRIAWEISHVSGARVDVPNLTPALTARGPVLRAEGVTIEHPAIDQVRLFALEIAPRLSMSWFGGDPTLRLWAESGLGNIDGILRLGDEPAYVGQVSEVELSRLPLRIEATGVRFRGLIEADADVALAPNGTLQGRVEFESPSLVIESSRLPIAVPFSRAAGVIDILESGATRIDSLALEGEVLEAELSGEISLVHRTQSPPIDLLAHIRVVNPTLRQLASGAGLDLSPSGETDVRVGGTLDAPEMTSAGAPPAAEAGRDRRRRQ